MIAASAAAEVLSPDEHEPDKPMNLPVTDYNTKFEMSPKSKNGPRSPSVISSRTGAPELSKTKLEIDPELCSLNSDYEMISDMFDYRELM